MTVAALVVSALAATLQPKSADDPTAAYTGKYAKDPRFVERFGSLATLRERALKAVSEKLGLSPKDPERIHIELRDAMPEKPAMIVPFKDVPFKTEGYGQDGKVVIRIHTEFVIAGRYSLEEELVHEMTHAVMREGISKEVYQALPRWLIEGLALWVAGQGPQRLVNVVKQPSYDPEKQMPGLEEGKHTLERYAESALALEYIEKQKGVTGVRELTKRLMAGVKAHEALNTVTEMGWSEFRDACRDYARGRAKEVRPTEADEWADILTLEKAREENKTKYVKLREACERFLKEHPASPLRGYALYYLGKACRLTRDRADADKSLLQAIAYEGGRGGYVDDALYQLGAARIEAGDFKAGAEPFERLLLDYPESFHLDAAVYKLALCRAKGGDKVEARRLLDVFERSFPESKYAKDVQDLRLSLE